MVKKLPFHHIYIPIFDGSPLCHLDSYQKEFKSKNVSSQININIKFTLNSEMGVGSSSVATEIRYLLSFREFQLVNKNY